MKQHAFRCLAAAFLLAGVVCSAPALAQDIAAAEALFNKGLADMEAGRYATGCEAIAESQRLDPRAGTLFTLATCEAQWGHIATAVTRYGDYLNLYDRLPEDKKPGQGERPNVARAERDKLSPLVPQLTLSLPKDAPAGVVVKRDGEVVSDAALGIALPVDPGDHVVTVEAPGLPPKEQKLTIAKGEKKVVMLEVPSTAALPPPTTAPVTPPPSRSLVGPIVGFGVGVVGLGVGIGLGAVVLGKRADLEKACPGLNCPASEQGNLDDAKTLSYVSTAGFVLAGVGAAVGVVLLFVPLPGSGKPGTDQSKKAALRVGPSYIGMEGAF